MGGEAWAVNTRGNDGLGLLLPEDVETRLIGRLLIKVGDGDRCRFGDMGGDWGLGVAMSTRAGFAIDLNNWNCEAVTDIGKSFLTYLAY